MWCVPTRRATLDDPWGVDAIEPVAVRREEHAAVALGARQVHQPEGAEPLDVGQRCEVVVAELVVEVDAGLTREHDGVGRVRDLA
jgi:hypothetical protein